ncbi:uncharacterized protein B0H18DRAFT_162390 [Fomitopsis serialis]|uniref:uncharacterized protein n=1 Tax=Fomitopsis serialis TaxID=139415 RepID=UPI002007A03A|nr:uncharacterized protein B0H18DRAFT_162390 [Neoantrodia serialis]KAH9930128.1 hypothetical protein B0H18DRAFT_162390 [Neoantrodia serialis]
MWYSRPRDVICSRTHRRLRTHGPSVRSQLTVLFYHKPDWLDIGFMRNDGPYIGTYHTADIPEFFTDIDYIGMDALIYFAHYLNPNAPSDVAANVSYLSNITWPLWNSSLDAPPLLTFVDPVPSVQFTADTYRLNATDLLTALFLQSS